MKKKVTFWKQLIAAVIMMAISFTMFASWGMALSQSKWWFIVTFASGIACAALTPWIRKVFDPEIERD